MDAQAGHSEEPSIGDLFGELADNGRAFLRAEADLYKAIARRRAAKARSGAAALVAALFLLNAALVTFMICIALALALVVGPLLAGLITFAAVAVIAFFLVRYGAEKLKALSGDPEEKAALAAGERLA